MFRYFQTLPDDSDVFEDYGVGGIEGFGGGEGIYMLAVGELSGEAYTVATSPPRFDTDEGAVRSGRPYPYERCVK